MKIDLVVPGGIRSRSHLADIEDYFKRSRRYFECALVDVRQKKVSAAQEVAAALATEATTMRKRMKGQGIHVALDVGGRAWSSEKFAERLGQWRDRAAGTVWFTIGSAYGLDPDFVRSADERLSLSPMTLPHELAALVLAEQVYRASAILSGAPYHK